MTFVVDPAPHQIWTDQVVQILDGEFGADQGIELPKGPALHLGFAPIADWFVDAVVPLILNVAALRGEAISPTFHRDQIIGPAADLTMVEQLITAQLRYNFGFDAYFDAMHQSALDFAAENTALIKEHFGDAENYAEYYADTSCETMEQIAAQGFNRVLVERITGAFQDADVAAWTACFPGGFIRGTLTSYNLAQGPTAPAKLASTLKRKLCAAFDTTDERGESNGPKQS